MRINLFQSKSHIDNNAELLPCVKGEVIVKEQIEALIQEIKQQISVPAEVYQQLYWPLFINLAEFCQSMPIKEHAAAYSLLTTQLQSALATLKLRRQYMLSPEKGVEKMAALEPIWIYACFTASALFQLARIQQDRSALLYNAKGEKIGNWHPVVGSLYGEASYFTLHWQPAIVTCNRTVTAALIKQLLPAKALYWLVQEAEVFTVWWDTLTNPHSTTIIAKLIQQAATAIHYPMRQENIENTSIIASQQLSETGVNENKALEITAQQNQQKQPENKTIQSDPQAQLNQLLDWLTACAANPSITTSSAYFRLAEGLFINKSALQNFISESDHVDTISSFIAETQPFLMAEEDNYFFNFRPKDYVNEQKLEGIILKADYLSPYFKKLTPNDAFIPYETL